MLDAWRQEYGMLDEPSVTLTDNQLRIVLADLRRELPELGEKMVKRRLRSMRHTVSREHVRKALRTTDPINIALRWQGICTARRPYSNIGHNSLWHMGEHL